MKRMLLLPFLAAMLISFAVPSVVSAQGVDCTKPENAAACNPQNQDDPCLNPKLADGPLCKGVKNSTNPVTGDKGILTAATRFVSWLVGVASIIGIFVGSIRYTIAGGDANAVSAAKKTILYSLIGVVVALFAQAMVILVL